MVVQDVQFNRSLLGVKRPAGRFSVTREAILRYAAVTGYGDHIHAGDGSGPRGVVAPPAFCAVLSWAIRPLDIDLKGVGAGLLAGETIHRAAPVYARDTLEATIHLQRVYTKTGRSGIMTFVVWTISFTNQDGHLVETEEKSFVYKERE